jgi:hypothetical protein
MENRLAFTPYPRRHPAWIHEKSFKGSDTFLRQLTPCGHSQTRSALEGIAGAIYR